MRNKNTVYAVLALLALSLLFTGVTVEAKSKKNKVSYTVKKNTLIIKGKGALKRIRFDKKDKTKYVTKIVVKKGVTSIPTKAFQGCKRVKEIKIANTVKKIGQEAFDNCDALKKVTIHGDCKLISTKKNGNKWIYLSAVDKLVFTTNLTLKNIEYIGLKKIVLKKKDAKYKMINGAIYSKDGKILVRVPSATKKLVVAEGCEEFCLQAIMYAAKTEGCMGGNYCGSLNKIVLPTTLKKVDGKKYTSSNASSTGVAHFDNIKIEAKSSQMDLASIELLNYYFPKLDMKVLQENNPEKIFEKDKMYYTSENVLLRYIGNAEEVIVPEGIKSIARKAFYKNRTIKKVILPEGLEEIGEKAFADAYNLAEVKLPTTLKNVAKDAFAYCAFSMP